MKKVVLDIETAALHPTEGRIVCISVYDIETDQYKTFFNEDEEKLLEDFLIYYQTSGFEEIITYNGYFDFRFIFGRCLKYNILPKGFFGIKVTDIMQTLKSVQRVYCWNKPGTLDEWSTMIFGESKIANPECVKEMFERGKFHEIITYCENDVRLTYKLWQRIQGVLYG